MKVWVTIFERFESYHFNKDVGQLIYHAQQCLGFNSSLWRKSQYQDDLSYPFSVENINCKRTGCKISLAIIFKIIREARKIDVLNLFHFRIYSIIYALIYKIINPNGKTILKCDFSQVDDKFENDSLSKRIFFSALIKFKAIDLLLIEHMVLVKKFQQRGFNCRYTPNGVSAAFYNLDKKHIKNKIPTIIFVGKCGDPRKNAEELISATLPFAAEVEFEIYFLGGQTDKFRQWFNDTVDIFLRPKFIFFDMLTDVGEIYKLYSQSHIFVMTSLQEGYPLSLAEACWQGCYPILSERSGGNDLAKLGAATIYKDTDELSEILKLSIINIDSTISLGSMAQKEIRTRNDWRVLFDYLKRFIK